MGSVINQVQSGSFLTMTAILVTTHWLSLCEVLRPPEVPNCCWGEAPSMDGDDNDFMFAGLNYLFLRCRKQKIWAADYPVVFHPHLCTNCSAQISSKGKTLRQKAVHQVLINPRYICENCNGYRPGYDRRFTKPSRQPRKTLAEFL